MKSLTSTAVVALTAGLIAVGSIVPAAYAQQQPAPQPPAAGQQMQPGDMPGRWHWNQQQRRGHMGSFNLRRGGGMPGMEMRRGGMARGGLLNLVCSDRAAERLEIAFVRLSYALELTAEQQPLFDDLRTTALTAQTQFADRCKAANPTASAAAPAQNGAAPATTTRDPVAGMRARLELDKARIAALETVLPKFEQFYNSLTDAQKAELSPGARRGGQGFGRNRGPGMGMMPNGPRPGMNEPAPGDDAQPAPAPAQPTPGAIQG